MHGDGFSTVVHCEGAPASETSVAEPDANLIHCVAECSSSDLWNCKYCNKKETCEALKDPRNFGTPMKNLEDDHPYCRECGGEQLAHLETYANGSEYSCKECNTKFLTFRSFSFSVTLRRSM